MLALDIVKMKDTELRDALYIAGVRKELYQDVLAKSAAESALIRSKIRAETELIRVLGEEAQRRRDCGNQTDTKDTKASPQDPETTCASFPEGSR